MKREGKSRLIENIVNVFSSSHFLILVSFQSMDASDSLNLRNSLKSIGVGFLVVKNTLARLAIKRVGKFSYLSDKFKGPVAIVYSADIVMQAIKLIVDFTNTHKEKMSIVCATHLDQLLTVDDVNALARLPSLDELRIKVMRAISYNLPSQLGFLMNSSSIRLMRALSYYSSKN